MEYKVKEVADMVGISVRTLHHYDHIGLLKPESISSAGYRLYTDKNIDKLQQILFFKELNFNLKEIKNILDNPKFNRKEALINHKKILIEKRKRIEKIIESIDKTIYSIEGGIEMNKREMFEGFDIAEIEKLKEKYAKEAKEKYGECDAYKESIKKTSKYTKEDWNEIKKSTTKIYKKIIDNMDKGISNLEVQSAVNELRKQITTNFYNCTPEIFKGLAYLYISDERFTANIDKHKKGLAKFLSEAMHYYCNNL